jgi:hypothetical protein
MKGRIKLPGRTSLLALVVVAAALLATQTAGFASGGQWKLGSYTAKGGFSFKGAGTGMFTFPVAPNAALLVTDQKPLIGDDTAKTITAKFTLTDPANNFTYYGEPDGSGALFATARLYFDDKSILSSTGVGTDYWWSNPYSVVLTDGQLTVSATIDPASWSDYNGQFGNVDGPTTIAFNAAAAHVQDIGLSFGGGYFFANGVGAPDGLGTFTLDSFGVS